MKNLKVDYQDGIAVVQFNQENSKVVAHHSPLAEDDICRIHSGEHTLERHDGRVRAPVRPAAKR